MEAKFFNTFTLYLKNDNNTKIQEINQINKTEGKKHGLALIHHSQK
jgi:hypothetical protein